MVSDDLILEHIPFTAHMPYTEYLTHFHNVKEQSSHAMLFPAWVEFCFSLKTFFMGAIKPPIYAEHHTAHPSLTS